jgi:gas vesicle protein
MCPTNLSVNSKHGRKVQLCTSRRPFTVQAAYSDGGRPNSGSIFIGGFVLGGIIVGTLGCVYAPQISKALTGTDRKKLMSKLPKFIYDEDKVLEKQRKKLAEKIEQLNAAIDDVSSQLRTDENDVPNGVAVNSDEVEAAI